MYLVQEELRKEPLLKGSTIYRHLNYVQLVKILKNQRKVIHEAHATSQNKELYQLLASILNSEVASLHEEEK